MKVKLEETIYRAPPPAGEVANSWKGTSWEKMKNKKRTETPLLVTGKQSETKNQGKKTVIPDAFEPKSGTYKNQAKNARHERSCVHESRVKNEACHMASKI